MHGIIEEEELEDEGSNEDEDLENNWNSQSINLVLIYKTLSLSDLSESDQSSLHIFSLIIN